MTGALGKRSNGYARRMLHRGVAERIHMIEDAYVNWFLVEEAGKLTVVDSGHPSSWKSLQSALSELGHSSGDIEALVLTHAHFDHMGFARRAHQQLGVPVWAHELETPVVRHPWRYEHERSRWPYFVRHPGFVKIFTAMGVAGALWVKGLEDVRTYEAGERLDVPGRPQVVFTPGHTHGHSSLAFPDRGTVIAGDAIVTLNPYTARTGPQIVAGAATADSARALASLDALAATRADTVLCGHGAVWKQGTELAVERARAAGPS
jgi:glyoxylase-like metal-dependent hydrolase (beta-lactamase superfamily II)